MHVSAPSRTHIRQSPASNQQDSQAKRFAAGMVIFCSFGLVCHSEKFREWMKTDQPASVSDRKITYYTEEATYERDRSICERVGSIGFKTLAVVCALGISLHLLNNKL